MASPYVQAIGAVKVSTGSITPVYPPHQADDIALLIVETEGRGTSPISFITQAGFAEVKTSRSAEPPTGDQSCQVHMWWVRCTSSSQAQPTVADSTDHNIGYLMIIRGCVTTGDPFVETDENEKEPESTAISIAGVTTSLSDMCIIYAIAGAKDAAANYLFGVAGPTNASLSSLTKQADYSSTINNVGGQLAIVSGAKATAGAIGTLTGTSTNTNLNAWIIAAFKSPTSTPSVTTNKGNFFRLLRR
jgi:hypothetical protein